MVLMENRKIFTIYLRRDFNEFQFGREFSEDIEVFKEVPEGSKLGRLLFFIFAMNMYFCIKECVVHQYCYDTQIYISRFIHQRY